MYRDTIISVFFTQSRKQTKILTFPAKTDD